MSLVKLAAWQLTLDIQTLPYQEVFGAFWMSIGSLLHGRAKIYMLKHTFFAQASDSDDTRFMNCSILRPVVRKTLRQIEPSFGIVKPLKTATCKLDIWRLKNGWLLNREGPSQQNGSQEAHSYRASFSGTTMNLEEWYFIWHSKHHPLI